MGLRLNKFVATAGGIGYLPFAPGTWAAIVTAVAWFFIFRIFQSSSILQLVILPLIIIAGIYSSGRISEGKDPAHIVIDEVAGMCLTLLFITPTYQNIIAGFILFRFFDIAKPFGIRKMEKIGDGWGIMLDDMLAGLYSNIILRLLILIHVW